MSAWQPILRLRRLWDGRFLKALARLEALKHRQERCGGCGVKFGEHPDDFSECVRKVLSDTSQS